MDTGKHSPEDVLRAREEYLKGTRVADILTKLEWSEGTLYYWLDGGPLEGDGRMFPAIPRRQRKRGCMQKPLSEKRAKLVGKLWRTAERQVDEIEKRMSAGTRAPDERDRDARLLAVLVKTLRELSEMDAAASGAGGDADDDEFRDMDEFRRDLARRMDAIVARRTESVSGES